MPEAHVEAREIKPVPALRIVLIAGDRPAGESLPQAFTLFFQGFTRFQLRREYDRQGLCVAPAVKAVDTSGWLSAYGRYGLMS